MTRFELFEGGGNNDIEAELEAMTEPTNLVYLENVETEDDTAYLDLPPAA